MTDITFLMVSLTNLVPSPTNPRKFFDEEKTQELSASISEKGVLQPILVRKVGKKYEIVAGERRYRASLLAAKSEKVNGAIPVIVRDLSDQEVREMQLIENFQRQDVHPMEEAVAIKAAVDSGKYSYDDIAAKVGKKLPYIRQRMKLNELTADWQKVFYRNGISIGDATKICALPSVAQTEIFQDVFEDGDNGIKKYEIPKWVYHRYKGDLESASFDLSDETLDNKMGACIRCTFNSSVNQLFPELALSKHCTNIACFNNKSTEYFNRELAIAKEDPAIILITGTRQKNAIVDKLKKEGEEVVSEGYGEDCNIISAPDKPVFEDVLEEWLDDNDNNPNGSEEEFLKKLEEYQKEYDAYQKKIATGKYKKAFVVADSGYDTGKYVYVEINKKSASAKSKKGDDPTTAGLEDIDSEISRLTSKEERSSQLDEVKIWDELKRHFNPVANAEYLKEELDQVEREAAAMAISNKLNYHNKRSFAELFKIKNDDFSKVTAEDLNGMIRFFFCDTLPPVAIYSGYTTDALVALKIADRYFPSVLNEIKDKHNAVAAKRK